MNRRCILAAALVLGLFPRLAFAADPLDVRTITRVQDYLNSITTLKARFLQIAPDGKQTQGTAWLDRPGRMRFEYDKPSPLLLVANGQYVVFHDSELGQTSTIPLSKTPLGILLAAHVDLEKDVTVQAIDHLPGEVSLTLARTATPADGQLTLTFSDDPLLLRSWTVTDAQHTQTKVSLFDLDQGGNISSSLFNFETRLDAPD